jgi:hypothetical protein
MNADHASMLSTIVLVDFCGCPGALPKNVDENTLDTIAGATGAVNRSIAFAGDAHSAELYFAYVHMRM